MILSSDFLATLEWTLFFLCTVCFIYFAKRMRLDRTVDQGKNVSEESIKPFNVVMGGNN